MRTIFVGSNLLAGTVLVTSLILAGCASTPAVNWDTRVGQCTYEQAVAELGPPDQTLKFADGSVTAQWITRRVKPGRTLSATAPGDRGMQRPITDRMEMEDRLGTSSFERHLNLTFAPGGTLSKWEEGYR